MMPKTKSFMKKKHLLLISSMIFALSFMIGCGPSYEEKQAKKKQEEKKAAERQRQEEKKLLSHLTGKYEISFFPPEEFKNSFYTYELQKHFADQSDKHIAFKGYLVDLEQTDNNTFIEFSCAINPELYNPDRMVFRLQITEKQAANFLNKKYAPLDRLLSRSLMRYLLGPNYLIIARVNNVSKIRKYEISGSPDTEDEVEINIETPLKFMAKGVLVDAIKISRQKDEEVFKDLFEDIKP